MDEVSMLLARMSYHTIGGYAKGLADGLEGHLNGRWEINLHGILDGLRQIERISEREALGEPQATRPNPSNPHVTVSPEIPPSRPE